MSIARKWKTNSNGVVIQPKYLFHKFSSTTGIGFSVGVNKRGAEKEGKISEEKTRGSGEWGGGVGFAEGISNLPNYYRIWFFLPRLGVL